MCRMLAGEELQMREVVASQMKGQRGPNTWFRGKDPIDGIWITNDLEVIRAGYLPFDANVGDHRPVMADLTKDIKPKDTKKSSSFSKAATVR